MGLSSAPSALPRHTAAGARRHRRRGRRHLALLLALFTALLAVGTGTVLGVRTVQQNAAASARDDREAARQALDAALLTARDHGVDDLLLLPVTAARADLLGRPAVAPLLLVFDGGETGHLQRQAQSLRALAAQVPAIEAAELARLRSAGTDTLKGLDAAITAAAGVGIDVGADRQVARESREALAAATTPKAARQAVNGIEARTLGLQSRAQSVRDAVEAAARPARNAAQAEMAASRRVLATALQQGIDPGALSGDLDSLQAQLDAATTAAEYTALTGRIHDVAAPVGNRLGVAELGSGKVIVISLDRQEMTAYEDGVPYLTTYVTSGRPALPTVTGSFRVQTKYHPFLFRSEWPYGSPYWFAPSLSNYAMFFFEGYAIHDAPWRAEYGPGTNLVGSHGCVNVPYAPMVQLYAWTPLGTRVIVH